MSNKSFVTSQLSPVNFIPQVHGLVAQGLLFPLSPFQVTQGFSNVCLQPPQL